MEPNNPVFVNPLSFNPINLFVIMLVDGSGIISDGIKIDTGGRYNHSATIHKPKTVDSQDMFFAEQPLSKFMTSNNRLKFWTINNLTSDEWNILNSAIEADLALPPWRRFYNYLGVLFQALKLDWHGFPGTYFCSQRVSKYLRLLPRIAAVLPENVSPVFDDTDFINHPELFSCQGFWFSD